MTKTIVFTEKFSLYVGLNDAVGIFSLYGTALPEEVFLHLRLEAIEFFLDESRDMSYHDKSLDNTDLRMEFIDGAIYRYLDEAFESCREIATPMLKTNANDVLLADAWRSGVKIGKKRWQQLNQDEDNRRLESAGR